MSPQLSAMHSAHGVCPGHVCGECCNLVTHDFNRRYFKCLCYGESHSTATDWRKWGEACGQYNKPFDPAAMVPLLEVLKHTPRRAPEGPLPGQIDFMEGAPP